MRSFEHMNPAAVSVQILLTATLTVFCMDPVLLGISLLCGLTWFILRNKRKNVGFHVFALGVPALFAMLNPLWNQHGTSVLFFINSRAVTVEALIYGGVVGLRLAAVLYWFRCFSDLMTSEKLFYLFRFLSPKLALIFSMAVRNISLFRAQMRRIQDAQRAIGLYREGHLIDDVRGGLRVFSILLTWALENGIITASSMAARGYGIGKRSSYTVFRIHVSDIALILFSVFCAGAVIACLLNGSFAWQYYPKIVPPKTEIRYVISIISYACLAILPLLHEGKESLTWYRLRSAI